MSKKAAELLSSTSGVQMKHVKKKLKHVQYVEPQEHPVMATRKNTGY